MNTKQRLAREALRYRGTVKGDTLASHVLNRTAAKFELHQDDWTEELEQQYSLAKDILLKKLRRGKKVSVELELIGDSVAFTGKVVENRKTEISVRVMDGDWTKGKPESVHDAYYAGDGEYIMTINTVLKAEELREVDPKYIHYYSLGQEVKIRL